MMFSTEAHGLQSQREQEYLAGWQRARAELQNARKRFADQRQQESEGARSAALEELLPLADHFRVLVAHLPKELEDNPWVQGVTHVVREFERFLADQGIEEINPANTMFDPVLHEAVEQVEGERENMVVEVVQIGYTYGGRVLRPAKVRVAK